MDPPEVGGHILHCSANSRKKRKVAFSRMHDIKGATGICHVKHPLDLLASIVARESALGYD